ncbi:hypothetical protein CL617_02725 [archaeon]|nr:hypothetical protein [archaeon]|tara:strand:- start:7781 stop:8263 length:483 start_codon:yes stop_codon:yes gene_type:complete
MIEILSFLGLIFGIFISKISKEELKDWERYFDVAYSFLLIIIAVLIFDFSYMILLGILIGFFLYFILKNIYFYFGLLLSVNGFVLPLVVLIFIIGLVYSRKFIDLTRERIILEVMKSFVIFIIPFVLVFFGDFVLSYNVILNGICIGAFLHAIKEYIKRH